MRRTGLCCPAMVLSFVLAAMLVGCGGGGGGNVPTAPIGPPPTGPVISASLEPLLPSEPHTDLPPLPSGPQELADWPEPLPDVNHAEYVLAENVVVIGDDDSVGTQEADGVRVVSQQANGEIVLTGRVPELHPGDVLISKLGTPFLGKVVSVDDITVGPAANAGGQTIRVVTTQATLTEVFDRANIEFVKNLTLEDVEEVIPLSDEVALGEVYSDATLDVPALRLPFTLFSRAGKWPEDDDDENKEPPPVKGDTGEGGGGSLETEFDVSLTGEVGLQPSVELTLRLDWWWDIIPTGVSEFAAAASARQWTEVDFAATGGVKGEYEKRIGRINFAGVWVGPIWIRPVIDVYAGMQFELTGELTTSMSYEIFLRAGARYSGGRWEDISEFRREFNWERPSIEINLNVQVGLTVKPRILIFESLGPALVFRGFVEGNIKYAWEPIPETMPPDYYSFGTVDIDLYVGLEAGLEFEIEIFGFPLTGLSKPDLLSWKWPLWHWDYEFRLERGEHGETVRGPLSAGGIIDISGLPPPLADLSVPMAPMSAPAAAGLAYEEAM